MSSVDFWDHLLTTQKGLDAQIVQSRGADPTSGGYVGDMYLALRVEIAEYANETRCFKTSWSGKPASPRATRIEEAADVLAFYLVLFNHYHIKADLIHESFTNALQWPDLLNKYTLAHWINKTLDHIDSEMINFQNSHAAASLRRSFLHFIRAIYKDEINLQELAAGYIEKTKKNYERQAQGY